MIIINLSIICHKILFKTAKCLLPIYRSIFYTSLMYLVSERSYIYINGQWEEKAMNENYLSSSIFCLSNCNAKKYLNL